MVDREELRLRIDVDRGSESDDPPRREALRRRVAGLSEPGYRVDVQECRTVIEFIPRRPADAFAQAGSLIRAERRTSVDVQPARPLADAVARIQADLDAGADPAS